MSEDDGDSDADGDEVDDLASVGSYGDNALERGEYRALKTMSGGVELQRSSRSQEIPTNSRASSYGSRASNKHAKRRKGQLSQTERAARARARRPSRRYLRRCTMPTPWRLANVTHVGACLAGSFVCGLRIMVYAVPDQMQLTSSLIWPGRGSLDRGRSREFYTRNGFSRQTHETTRSQPETHTCVTFGRDAMAWAWCTDASSVDSGGARRARALFVV